MFIASEESLTAFFESKGRQIYRGRVRLGDRFELCVTELRTTHSVDSFRSIIEVSFSHTHQFVDDQNRVVSYHESELFSSGDDTEEQKNSCTVEEIHDDDTNTEQPTNSEQIPEEETSKDTHVPGGQSDESSDI